MGFEDFFKSRDKKEILISGDRIRMDSILKRRLAISAEIPLSAPAEEESMSRYLIDKLNKIKIFFFISNIDEDPIPKENNSQTIPCSNLKGLPLLFIPPKIRIRLKDHSRR
jgi:hypothetical protein